MECQQNSSNKWLRWSEIGASCIRPAPYGRTPANFPDKAQRRSFAGSTNFSILFNAAANLQEYAYAVRTTNSALRGERVVPEERDLSDLGAMYIDDVFRSLRGHKRLADGAIAQLSDEQFFALPDAESNSVAILVKHMAGNMRSRFTDFLTTDGEKPDRNRDQEFVVARDATREEILAAWEKYWHLVFDLLNGLSSEDLARTVTIRSQPHSVLQALNRQVAHYSYHVGQIVFLAKHWKGDEWKTLSVPRGKSAEVTAAMAAKFKDK
jgi:uncharacterized damage-inducible protein DinB